MPEDTRETPEIYRLEPVMFLDVYKCYRGGGPPGVAAPQQVGGRVFLFLAAGAGRTDVRRGQANRALDWGVTRTGATGGTWLGLMPEEAGTVVWEIDLSTWRPGSGRRRSWGGQKIAESPNCFYLPFSIYYNEDVRQLGVFSEREGR